MGSTGGVDRGKGRLLLVFCCSSRGNPENWVWGEKREWRRFMGSLPDLLVLQSILRFILLLFMCMSVQGVCTCIQVPKASDMGI